MYQKILVPLDGSEFAECSLKHVRSIAVGCKVPKVVLLRVVEPVPKDYHTLGMPGGLLADEDKKLEAAAKDYLTNLGRNLKKDGITTEAVVLQGTATESILDYITNDKVDLIIMSTHGRSGISRWALGSVAEKVIRHANVPILSASPPGCRV